MTLEQRLKSIEDKLDRLIDQRIACDKQRVEWLEDYARSLENSLETLRLELELELEPEIITEH